MRIFNRRHNNGREDEQPTEVVKPALDPDAVELLKNDPEEYFRLRKEPGS